MSKSGFAGCVMLVGVVVGLVAAVTGPVGDDLLRDEVAQRRRSVLHVGALEAVDAAGFGERLVERHQRARSARRVEEAVPEQAVRGVVHGRLLRLLDAPRDRQWVPHPRSPKTAWPRCRRRPKRRSMRRTNGEGFSRARWGGRGRFGWRRGALRSKRAQRSAQFGPGPATEPTTRPAQTRPRGRGQRPCGGQFESSCVS